MLRAELSGMRPLTLTISFYHLVAITLWECKINMDLGSIHFLQSQLPKCHQS